MKNHGRGTRRVQTLRNTTILKLSTGFALGMFGAAVADAQQADTGAAQAAAGPAVLEQIVVTAQRRSESLQRAAIAVTAITSDELVRAGMSEVRQLTSLAPSLQISSLGGSVSTFYLRGVGNFSSNSLSDAAIAVNLDGVTISRSGAVQGMFYDLERVEVLKGPQGTLYGRNATGGAINVITAKPQLEEMGGYITAEYGNFDTRKITSAVNVPVGDSAAFRAAGFLSDRDGYYSDGAGDDETRAIRLQGAAELTDNFKLTVGGDFAQAAGKGGGLTIHGLDRNDRIGLADPRAQAVYASTFPFHEPIPGDAFIDNDYTGAYAQADIGTPIGTLTILPAYREADIDFLTYGTSFTLRSQLKSEQFSSEARLAGDTGRLSYLLGLYFLNEDTREIGNFNQPNLSSYTGFRTHTKSHAGFGRLTFNVTDEVRLTGGLRYTIDEKSADLEATNGIVVCLSSSCPGTPRLPVQPAAPDFLLDPSGAPIPVQPWGPSGAILLGGRSALAPSHTFRKATYRLGFEYDAAPESLLFGSFETGFKSGGFFNTVDDPVYDPETIKAFTIGSKNRFLEDRLQVNVEAFWWIYGDQQVSHLRLNSSGGVEGAIDNIGKTRIRGVEVDTVARIAKGTTLKGMVQYLDAKVTEFTYAEPFHPFLAPAVTGCPVTLIGGNFVVDCSGTRALNAPEWTISGGIEQQFVFSSGSRLVFNAVGRYQSWTYTGFEKLPEQRQNGYFMADLHLQYELAGPQVAIAIFVNNVTDRNVASFSQAHPSAPSLITDALRPPRTYGVRLGYKF